MINSFIKMVMAMLIMFSFGCAPVMLQPPQWAPIDDNREAEYIPYLEKGTASLVGQAFLAQAGGGVVKGAGRTVTLDPATSVGNEWWNKAGKIWGFRNITPSSSNFHKARKSTIADADGRFKFSSLPAGQYYVKTEVTWEIGGYYPTQGGIVGQLIQIQDDEVREVILNEFAQ